MTKPSPTLICPSSRSLFVAEPAEGFPPHSLAPGILSAALLASLIFSWNVGLGLADAVSHGDLGHRAQSRRHAGPISPGTGARMGALMGLFTFVFSFLLLALSILSGITAVSFGRG